MTGSSSTDGHIFQNQFLKESFCHHDAFLKKSQLHDVN